LKKKLARIDENISKYLTQMNEEDDSQPSNSEYTTKQVKDAIKNEKNNWDELILKKLSLFSFYIAYVPFCLQKFRHALNSLVLYMLY